MRTLASAALVLLLAAVAVLALPAASAQDEFPGCGDIELVFRNPDLRPDAQGFIHASGQFFIQFQAIGANADQIATFGFSFGPDTVPFDESACDVPIWFTGPYVMNYRADRDPSDGFFIPIKTDLVPDGTYAAAVHAYDANNNELARFWARAIVDNCDGDPPARCVDDVAQQTPHDIIGPWPMVLPGDGAAPADHHLSIEFGEPISALKVFLNGVDITANLTDLEPRVWDADYFPDYGPAGTGNAVAPPCTQPFHTCIVYGPAFAWDVRALDAGDIIRVEAYDMAGNLARKDLHIGSGIAGGAITSEAPNLQITVDNLEKSTTPGKAVVFRFEMTNTGGGTAHPFTRSEAPEGWTAEFDPHKPVEPGQKSVQELAVTPPNQVAPGTHTIRATIAYPSQGGDEKRTYELKVRIDGASQFAPTNETATPEGEDTPGVSILIVPAVVGAAALVRRRRV